MKRLKKKKKKKKEKKRVGKMQLQADLEFKQNFLTRIICVKSTVWKMNVALIYIDELPLANNNKFKLDFSTDDSTQKINFNKKKH